MPTHTEPMPNVAGEEDARGRRTVRPILLLAALAAVGAPAAGCASLTNPFMGVPEWQTVRYGDEAPDPALNGVPRITAVEEREYAHYLQAASVGRIAVREVRGDWVYYAVANRRVVPKPGAGPGASGRAVAVVYERYRAKQPPAFVPRPLPELPDRETPRRDDAVVVPPGPEAEEMRKRIEEDLEKRRSREGGPKIIRPEPAGGR